MITVAYVDSDGIERSCAIGKEPVLVGRAPECGIRSNDPLVSRKHARLYVDPNGTLFIEDLGSANGVFVGPSRIQTSAIPVGAVVVAGSLRFRRLAGETPSASRPVPVEALAARRPTQAVFVPPSIVTTPAPSPVPGADAAAMLVHLLDVERKARVAVEEERDAYGLRMAQLHREFAAAQARIGELERTIAELQRVARERSGG
jgi:pSer/pThr/pTyr-binding forkhead associated (FHA) protein